MVGIGPNKLPSLSGKPFWVPWRESRLDSSAAFQSSTLFWQSQFLSSSHRTEPIDVIFLFWAFLLSMDQSLPLFSKQIWTLTWAPLPQSDFSKTQSSIRRRPYLLLGFLWTGLWVGIRKYRIQGTGTHSGHCVIGSNLLKLCNMLLKQRLNVLMVSYYSGSVWN